MSNYHIRNVPAENGGNIKTVNLVFHIPIPAGNNVVGVPWRDALVRHLGGAATIGSVLPEVVNTQEETDMKSGMLLEKSVMVRFSSVNLTDAQRLAEIEAAFTAEKNAELATKQIELKYFGKDGDVA
jgi:hypothetical protein